MNQINQDARRLASLAVFSELYDSQKDIYTIISYFLDDIIDTFSKHTFNLSEITNLLNETYDFSLPDAVVQTSLRKLDYLKKEAGYFIVSKQTKTVTHNIRDRQEKISNSHYLIIEKLLKYIQNKKDIILEDSDKERIAQCFSSFIMNDSNGEEYSDYISGFIIENKQSVDFRQQLNKIREGVVLYSGITYSSNSNLNELGSWNTELTIYLDTEILFHFIGYNGELAKSLFNDFFQYVKEINNKSSNRLIKLKYFSEVENEIEKFFDKAKYILEKQDILRPDVTAMISVLNGCKLPSDVLAKKSDFYFFLRTHDICLEETAECFDASNYKFNIIDQGVIEEISKEYEFDIHDYLCLLNYVHIKRKHSNLNNFYNIGCILLTGKMRTIKVAWHPLIKENGNVPLATTMDWLTNKFWFKLNKGLGNGSFPKSFDIITKAQLALAHVTSEAIGAKYDELLKKYECGALTAEQVKARILYLRTNVKFPEDIEQEDVPEIIKTLSEDNLEKSILEQELFKERAHRQVQENLLLKEDLLKRKNELKASDQRQLKLIAEVIDSKKELLENIMSEFDSLKVKKDVLDAEVNRSVGNIRKLFLIIILIYYAAFYTLIWKLGWDKIEQWTWILYTIPIIVSAAYFLITGHTINPKIFFENKKKEIKAKKYMLALFDDDKLSERGKAIEELKSKIQDLESSLGGDKL